MAAAEQQVASSSGIFGSANLIQGNIGNLADEISAAGRAAAETFGGAESVAMESKNLSDIAADTEAVIRTASRWARPSVIAHIVGF